MAEASPLSTPKRKHEQLFSDSVPSSLQFTKFSFEVPNDEADEDKGSPRTKVAQKFRGLDLDGGGGVGADDLARYGSPSPGQDHDAMDVDATARKRIRLPEQHSGEADSIMIAEVPAGAAASAEASPGEWASSLQAAVDPAVVRPAKTNSKLQKSYPSINRLADSKSRRKRAGTPPLVAATTKAGLADQSGDPDAEIVEPIRASLTWHEDEITIYDPDDEDDDGTGINGIGFKPTAAIAHARTMKRRQQLAEYKKREEKEARAKRSQRRRGSPEPAPAPAPAPDAPGSPRKVRFTESDPAPLVTT